MASFTDLSEVIPNHELRRRRWLKRIEKLVPQMLDKAEKQGGIVAANLGHKCLPGGRVVKFSLEARVVHQDSDGAHK
jgi:hypothetical protein